MQTCFIFFTYPPLKLNAFDTTGAGNYCNAPLCFTFRTFMTCFMINFAKFVFILLLCAKFEDILNRYNARFPCVIFSTALKRLVVAK